MPKETPAAERTVRSTVRQLYRLATPQQRRLFWWLCVLNTFMGLFEIGVAGGISLLGVAMSAPESLARFSLLENLRTALPFPGDMPIILQFLLIILGTLFLATLLKNLLLAYITWLQAYFSQGIAWNMGTELFRRFLAAEHIWHASQNSSDMLTALNWRGIVAIYYTKIMIIITQLFITIILLTGAFIANPASSGLLFMSIVTIAIFIQKYAKRKSYELSTAIRQFELRNMRISLQSIQGHKDISIYNIENALLDGYKKIIPGYMSTYSLREVFPNIPLWVLEFTGMFLLFIVLLFQVCIGSSVVECVATLTLLSAVSFRLLPAINKITGAIIDVRSNQPFVEKLLTYLDTLSAPTHIHPLPVRAFNKSIELKHISFTYPGSAQPALDDISLNIPKGSMVGVVGLSGSGKSTLVSLMTGLLTPQQGEIFVDGQAFSTRAERLHMGYVPQNLYLMDASLAKNVAFSHWGEPPDSTRVLESCRMAAVNFLDDLPDGMETELGERGVRLSGGQVQRVGIARALYDNPELLLFDEATSALDGAAEEAIQNTIDGLRAHMTLVLVAHRLTTVECCDIIYWIDNGKVRKQGPPQEVLPEYARMLHEKNTDAPPS